MKRNGQLRMLELVVLKDVSAKVASLNLVPPDKSISSESHSGTARGLSPKH